jgi:hypothetical protein
MKRDSRKGAKAFQSTGALPQSIVGRGILFLFLNESGRSLMKTCMADFPRRSRPGSPAPGGATRGCGVINLRKSCSGRDGRPSFQDRANNRGSANPFIDIFQSCSTKSDKQRPMNSSRTVRSHDSLPLMTGSCVARSQDKKQEQAPP